jgi:hypothetical protein
MAIKKRPTPPKRTEVEAWRVRFEERDKAAKAKATALSADRPDLTEADELADRYMISRRFGELTSVLEHNGKILGRIADALEVLAAQPRPTAEVPLQQYISGQWRRRDGDVYVRVAEPGSPNAGDIDDRAEHP